MAQLDMFDVSLICLAFFYLMLYIIINERGVCFRTALGESLCGSLLCYPLLKWIKILNPSVLLESEE